MRMGIQQKIGAVLLILIAISLGVIGLAYSSLETVHGLADRSGRLFLEFSLVSELQVAVEREVVPVKLFLISESPGERRQFQEGLKEVGRIMAKLKKLPISFGREKIILRQIQTRVLDIGTHADRIFSAERPDAAAKADAGREIDEQLASIDRLIEEWRLIDQAEVKQSLLEAHAVHGIKRGLLIGSLLILVIGAAIAFFVARFIVKPLLQLHDGVEKISRGDVAYTFKIETGDEIQDLAEAFSRLVHNLRQEEKAASDIQRRLLPQGNLLAPGVRIHARQMQAKLIGGDWFDYYRFEDEVRLLIADASGKGMPGALLATVGMSAIRSESKLSNTIESILRKTNKTVANRFGSTDFITLLSAQLSLKSNRFVYINCGHEPPLYYNAKNADWTMLSCPAGLPLGVSAEMFDPAPQSMTLSPGDKLILYTDGLHDVRDKQGRFLTMETIVGWLNQRLGPAIEPLTDELLNKAMDFSGGPLTDDITMVGIEITDQAT